MWPVLSSQPVLSSPLARGPSGLRNSFVEHFPLGGKQGPQAGPEVARKI